MSFKDLFSKEKSLKQKPASESSNLEVKSSVSSSSSSDSNSKKSK